MIHNGSTTGAEAALMGVPVISYQPHHERSELFTNRVGRVAHDEQELIGLVRDAMAPEVRGERSATPQDLAVLNERLSIDPDRLSAERIVDVWERHDPGELAKRNRIRTATIASSMHQRLGRLRTSAGAALLRGTAAGRSREFNVAPKFPPVSQADIDLLVKGFRQALGRFERVRVTRVAGRLLRVQPH
jgi:hypothetical protein